MASNFVKLRIITYLSVIVWLTRQSHFHVFLMQLVNFLEENKF